MDWIALAKELGMAGVAYLLLLRLDRSMLRVEAAVQALTSRYDKANGQRDVANDPRR